MKQYIFASSLFALLRQFCFPNPFEVLDPGLTIVLNETSILLAPDILNLLAEGPLGVITFGVVRIYYRDRSKPLNGSILYMMFFFVHSTFMQIFFKVYPQKLFVGLLIIAYILLHIGLIMVRNKIENIFIP